MEKVANLVLSRLIRTQVFASGDHVARNCNCQVSQTSLKQSELKKYPYDACDITRFTSYSHRI